MTISTDGSDTFVRAAVRAFASDSPCPSPPTDLEWIPRAAEAGVLAPVAASVTQAGHELPPKLRELSLGVTARHLRTMLDLQLAAEALEHADVSWAVLKGPVLRAVVFRDPGVRDYTDLDLLVGPHDIRRAIAALTELGTTLHPADWTGALGARTAEVALVLPHGTLLDLHWNLVNVGRVREAYGIDTDELLSRRVPRTVDGFTLWTLGDVDMVLHTLLHACLSGGETLRLLLDVQQALHWFEARGSIADLTRRARQLGLVAPVRVVTAAAARHIDSTLEPWVAEWASSPYTQLLDLVSSRRPPSAPSLGRRTTRTFFRSTRPTSWASFSALTRSAVANARYKRTPNPGPRPTRPQVTDPTVGAWLDLAESTSKGRTS